MKIKIAIVIMIVTIMTVVIISTNNYCSHAKPTTVITTIITVIPYLALSLSSIITLPLALAAVA